MLKKPLIKYILAFSLILLITLKASAETDPGYNPEDIFHPAIASSGMVSTQEKLATSAGLAVLQEGGNAVDAAVTIGFTLAVTLPRAGNLGGGGFMVIHQANDNQTITLDYREKAPLLASRNMFLNEKGEADPEKSRFSYLSVGVPGTVAGLGMALEKYGTISLQRALKPAITLAEEGFIVTPDFQSTIKAAQKNLIAYPASKSIFFKEDGSLYAVGETFKQPDLANSLKLISKQGIKAFYQGQIAEKIVADMANNGGLITKEDLRGYQPIIREPIKGTYHGYEVYSMPPPSSGGVHLVQMLNILEKFPITELGHNTGETIHLMAETMKLAYADRFKHLGDPDFFDVPISQLISKAYADKLREKINPEKATPSDKISPGDPRAVESKETTHYSVIDGKGNAVANTYTLNFGYGSGITAPGTGILLNNEMDDFSAKTGAANAYGLIGGEGNSIEPEKRMLSSMTPTIVLKDGKPFLVTGSPGGSRIITTVLQIVMNVIDHKMNIAEATNAIRIHHQWQPDKLFVEKDLNRDTINILKQKGQNVTITEAIGSTQSVMNLDNLLYGASDPRRPEALTLGF